MDQDRVGSRAHALWVKAGRPDGTHDQHWQQACREIEAEDGTMTGTMTGTTQVAGTIPDTAIHQPGEVQVQGRSRQPETTG